jgi:hypothetical protein
MPQAIIHPRQDQAISVLESWAKQVFDVLLDTLFLPFRPA